MCVCVCVRVCVLLCAQVFPKCLPSDSGAKFDSLELWTKQDAGDIVLGDPVVWMVPADTLSVITLDPDC